MEDFSVRVGVHQGSTLSTYLFSLVIDTITKRYTKWGAMVHDLMLVEESKRSEWKAWI